MPGEAQTTDNQLAAAAADSEGLSLDVSTLRVAGPKATAENILRSTGLCGVYPLPVDVVARLLKYRLVGFNPPSGKEDIAGFVKYDEKLIAVNAKDSVERQRFTIAHEIGHIVLKHQISGSSVDYRRTLDGNSTSSKEIEANKFAAELLMPAEDFLRAFFNALTDDQLAEKFGVSKSAVQVRKSFLKIT